LNKKFILANKKNSKKNKINVFWKNIPIDFSKFSIYSLFSPRSNVLLLFLIFLLFQCSKPYFWESNVSPSPDLKKETDSPKLNYLFIIRSMGESKVKHTDKTEEKGSAGIFLYEGDQIITEKNSSLDLQYSDELLIRILPGSNLILDSLSREGKNIKIALTKGNLYSKIFPGSESNKYTIHTPMITTISSGAELILSHTDTLSSVRVKFGKVVVYPRVKSLGDKDPMDIKPEESNGKIASSVSEKMLLLESMQEVALPYYPNFLLDLPNIESVMNYSKWISDLSIQFKQTKISSSEVSAFNSLALLEKKLIAELFSINREIQSEKDSKKMEELEAKRSLLENQLLKGTQNEVSSRVSLPVKDSKITKNPITRSISRRLSYYKKRGIYKKQASKILKTESELYDYYERLEKLTLTNDRIEVGTILSQDTNGIILHTEDGIKRIPAEEVLEVSYEYQKPRP
jgi:hypothetical protein